MVNFMRIVTDPACLVGLAMIITIVVTLFVIWGFTLVEHDTARTTVYTIVLGYCAALVVKQIGSFILMRSDMLESNTAPPTVEALTQMSFGAAYAPE